MTAPPRPRKHLRPHPVRLVPASARTRGQLEPVLAGAWRSALVPGSSHGELRAVVGSQGPGLEVSKSPSQRKQPWCLRGTPVARATCAHRPGGAVECGPLQPRPGSLILHAGHGIPCWTGAGPEGSLLWRCPARPHTAYTHTSRQRSTTQGTPKRHQANRQ